MNMPLDVASILQTHFAQLSFSESQPYEFICDFWEVPIPADAHSQWQMAVDIIHRCVMCDLIEFVLTDRMGGLKLVKDLARYDPYNKIQFNESGHKYWGSQYFFLTDSGQQLVEKHNVVSHEFESFLLCEPFIKELEIIFSNAGVPWGKSFFPVDLSSTYQSYMDRINGGCDAVLAWVFERGTLFQFPRVVAYLAKENGTVGWQDTYQNHLIARLKSSPWFEPLEGNLYRCTVDQSVWKQESKELMKNAYKERLICMDAKINNFPEIGAKETGHPVFFSKDFFRYYLSDPTDVQNIDIHFFVSYLTELQDGSHATIPASSPPKTSP